MRHSTKITTFLIAVVAISATSCYTQLRTTYSSYPGSGYHSSDSNTERVASGERAVEERSDQVVNEEDYTLGYDDGWSDAEAYYFKDYEAKRWYEEYGASLAHDPYVRHYTINNHYYGKGYSPFHSYYYPHYPYYSHAYWSPRWSFSLGFHVGWGWNSWHNSYYNFPPYNYYGYPGYYPYYGGYWGYHGPYYGNTIVIYNGSRGTSRNYGPRNNGLSSRGSETVRRTRSDARVRNTANRSDIRSNARSRNISTTRSRGSVNRSSGTTRSRSSSTVRSRSGSSSNSRGTVNRGSSNRSRSNGTVNRSRSSSSNRSNGTVNRSRSSDRGNQSANRSRTSNQSRSNVGSDGVIISRGTSIIRNRDNKDGRSTVNRRSADNNIRSRSATVNNRVQNYNSANDRGRVQSQRPQNRRERSIQSLRNELLEREKVEAPARFKYNRSTVKSGGGKTFFNNKTVRNVINSVVGNSSSRSRSSSSSVGRSSSSSNSRSSSVSRSRSSNSSRSTVRSSRSSSSSKSRGSSSSRSRSSSSSSRDRN